MSTLKIFLSLRGESLTLLSSQGENVCAHGPSLKGLETHHSFPQILCLLVRGFPGPGCLVRSWQDSLVIRSKGEETPHAAVADEAGGDEVSKDSAVAGVSTLVEAGRQVGARGA